MPERQKKSAGYTIGQLYKGIVVERGLPEGGEGKLLKKKMPRYVRFCKMIASKVPAIGAQKKFPEEHNNAIEFLGWDLRPEEFSAAVNFTALLLVFAAFAAWLVVVASPISKTLATVPYSQYAVLALLVVAALSIANYIYRYPISAAQAEQKKALGYIPEIVGYMIMSMKLTPNLEKAVEFSADHGRGKIAEEFKKLTWDISTGIYTTITEGLDRLAYRWGSYAPEFKRALVRIRASVLEDTEAKRDTVLNKTMDELLATIKEKMDTYARSLRQPAVVLFFVGVLLPLILMIILPIGSVFSGLPLANPLVIIALYNIAIPLGLLYFALGILKQRPPTQEAPEIPDDYPGLPPKNKVRLGNTYIDIFLLVAIVAFVGVIASYYFHQEGFPPKSMLKSEYVETPVQIIRADRTEKEVLERSGYQENYFDIPDGVLYRQYLSSYSETKSADAERKAETKVLFEKKIFFMTKENDITPYNLWFGLILTFSLCLFILLYYPAKYKRKIQLEISAMESEFKDALYIMASRLGENRPMEEVLKQTIDFLPNALISRQVFSKTIDNITLLGMPLDSAVFDQKFGSVARIPSEVIKTGMRLVVDASSLGTSIAARTLASLSIQLDNTEKVAKALKEMIDEITVTMRTMAVIIAPVVLGITTALFKIVVLTMASISQSISESNLGG
ncbi:MAG: type II secretion system F family protein, partial [Candidatus Diapherotrites archaeon]